MSTPNSHDSGPQVRRKDGLLTTGDMARLSSNTLRTVRFYEEAGLLRPVQRTDGGHRLFPPGELRKLQLISDLRAAGFSLEEIGELLEAKRKNPSPRLASQDVVARIELQLASMRTRLLLMQRLLIELEGARAVIARCADCPEPASFPQQCQRCARLEASDQDVSSVVDVLWNVEHE